MDEKQGNGVVYTTKELIEQMRSDIRDDLYEIKTDLGAVKTIVQDNTQKISDLMFSRRLLKIGAALVAFLVASVLIPLIASGKI